MEATEVHGGPWKEDMGFRLRPDKLDRGGWARFGTEYARASRWSPLERLYIRAFGWVDLPSRIRAAHVVAELRRVPARSLLDLGMGTGCYALCFARDGRRRVCGIDADPVRVAAARQVAETSGLRNVRFERGEVPGALRGFEAGCMDVVLAVELLQYVANLEETLAEIKRVLAPGGRLVTHVPMLGKLRPFERRLFDDEMIRQAVAGSGMKLVLLRQTFGPATRLLCRINECASRSRPAMSLLFPLLLALSKTFGDETSRGESRLFVAARVD